MIFRFPFPLSSNQESSLLINFKRASLFTTVSPSQQKAEEPLKINTELIQREKRGRMSFHSRNNFR